MGMSCALCPLPSPCALLPKGTESGQRGGTGPLRIAAGMASARVSGDQGALSPSTTGNGVIGGPAAEGQQM